MENKDTYYDRFEDKVTKNGHEYYLLITPQEGLSREQAELYCRNLKEKYKYRDCFIEESNGFFYVYGDPGFSLNELIEIITRFDWVEDYKPILEKIQLATLHNVPTGEKVTLVRCQRCNHIWESKSQMALVTCPSCGFKTPRESKESQKLWSDDYIPWPWKEEKKGGDKVGE